MALGEIAGVGAEVPDTGAKGPNCRGAAHEQASPIARKPLATGTLTSHLGTG